MNSNSIYEDFIITKSKITDVKNIFSTVSKIFSSFTQKFNAKTMPIVFDKDVKYINPLFFILLFSKRGRKNIKFAFDLTQLGYFQQTNAQHILRQKIDLKKIDLIKDTGNPTYNNIFNETDLNVKVIALNNLQLTRDSMFITEDATKNAIAFIEKKDYEYLPLMSLRRIGKLIEREDFKEIPQELDAEEKRKTYYSRVSLDNITTIEKFQKFLRYTIEDFLKYLGLESKNLHKPLTTILFELIDNIRKHTNDENVDGYFSFTRRKLGKFYEYQIIVADNGENGVLNTYLDALLKEQKYLSDKGIKEEELKEYKEIIEKLELQEEAEDKKVLNDLYNILKINHVHQIPRIAMHFGIPLLLKMINHFDDKQSRKNILEIYTHRNENYYKTYYSGSGNFKKTFSIQHNIKGTYIILTFTDKVAKCKAKDESNNTKTYSSLKNQDYKEILKNKEVIQNEISTFKVLYPKDLKEFKNPEPEKKIKKIAVNISEIGKETFSDFIRDLYLFAYKFNIEDIVVLNSDLDNNYSYLELLAHIMFKDNEKPYESPRNILFFNKNFPSSIFIGGKTKNEFLAFAEKLKSSYGDDVTFGLTKDSNENESNIEFSTKLIYNNHILPFELFTLKDENLNDLNLLQIMLINYLNKTKIKEEDIHIDTKKGYHIDGYFKFNKIFENSDWVKRIAFLLALELKDKNSNFSIVATDNYAGMVISLVASYLEEKNIKHSICNIKKNLSENYKKEYINDKTIYYSSVLLKGNTIKNFFNKYSVALSTDNWFSAIHLKLKNNSKNFKSIFSVDIKKYYIHKYNQKEDKVIYCEKCAELKDYKPIYNLNKKDPFLINAFYEDDYVPKEFSSYTREKGHLPKWINSSYFVHATRSNNHYTYYTKTIPFFRDNKDDIIEFLLDVKENKLKNMNLKKKIILIAPVHNTNNNFVTLVNKIVFNNDAVIWHFDKNKGEVNYHNWEKENIDFKETSIFFVDDEISSGYTLEYFYGLIRSIPHIMKEGNVGFDGIFVMIDRTSIYDENIICNYIRDDILKEKPHSLNSKERKTKKKKLFFAYTTLEIKPIKTEIEKCFLCKKQKEYIKLLNNSVLNMTRFKIAPKVVKLNKINADKIDYENNISFKDKIKNTIKMWAVDYLYQNFSKIKMEINKDFEDWEIVQEFWQNIVYKNIIKEFVLSDDNDKRFVGSILRYEAKIALIKAMSFPKLSYYKKIRDIIVGMLFYELNIKYKTYIKNNYKIKNTFNNKTINNLINKLKDKEIVEFLQKYNSIKDLNYFNHLLVTYGYLKEDLILNENYIKLYSNLIINNKTIKKDFPELFHDYPFAVKMVINNDREKTSLFLENLSKVKKEFEKEQKLDSKSLMDALYLEANTILKIKHTTIIDSIIDDDEDFSIKIKKLKNYLQDAILNDKKGQYLELKHFFIPKNFDYISKTLKNSLKNNYLDFNLYEIYLNLTSNELIDIFNNFQKLDRNKNLDNKIYNLYCGKLTEGSQQDALGKKIHNIWANDYVDNHTIIHLAKIDNELLKKNISKSTWKPNEEDKQNLTAWYKPIGCIVIKHKKESQENFRHHEITKKILTIQNDIVEYIEKEFSHGVIQEAIENAEYERIYRTYNHEVAPLFEIHNKIIEIKSNDELKEKLANYTLFMQEIVKIGRFKNIKTLERIRKSYNIKKMYEIDKKTIADFMEISVDIINNIKKVNINIADSVEKFQIYLGSEYIRPLLYELIFNAMKYSDKESNTLDIYVENNILYFKNKTKNINKCSDNIALSYLKYILERINYKFEYYQDNNFYYVKIMDNTIKEKNNV